jgi:hypothetical protein
MLITPFLTDLDSRAAIKGSRDPLGIQQIWTRLGRHVIGNLTTVSNSVRDFTTLLLGYYFAAQLADELGPGSELATFLKWEQLAAYSRAVANKDFEFRGTERVRKNLSEGRRVMVSANPGYQILGKQKIYGLWGLYTMPARSSALVDGDPPRLTTYALKIVEELYIPLLRAKYGKAVQIILNALRSQTISIDVGGRDRLLIEAIGHVLKRRLLTKERVFYRYHLLHGGPEEKTGGRQQQLAELLEDTLDQSSFTWSTAMVANLAKSARARGKNWHPLALRLDRIRISETVLAPVSMLFSHLLGLDGKSIESVSQRIRTAWGNGLRTVDSEVFRELRGEIGVGEPLVADRWVGIADAVATGDYKTLVTLLIDQNTAVMAARGGAPWIENYQGNLTVRFRDEHGLLSRVDDISTVWRFPYFLDSLRRVATTLKEKNSDG